MQGSLHRRLQLLACLVPLPLLLIFLRLSTCPSPTPTSLSRTPLFTISSSSGEHEKQQQEQHGLVVVDVEAHTRRVYELRREARERPGVEVEHELGRMNAIGRRLLEEEIGEERTRRDAWMHPEPFFVHPDGREIHGIILVTHPRFAKWRETMTTLGKHKGSCNFDTSKPAQGVCEWCPRDAKNGGKCFQGDVLVIGSMEEKMNALRKEEIALVTRRIALPAKPSGEPHVETTTRTVILQCNLHNGSTVPVKVEESVVWKLSPDTPAIFGEATRFQSLKSENSMNVKINPPHEGMNVMKLNFERFMKENDANRRDDGYEDEKIRAKHVVCSRALFGTVDGTQLAGFANYYKLQGFGKVVLYDVGVAEILHPEALAEVIRKGILVWVDMRSWLYRTYNYLSPDMIIGSMCVAQKISKYDCHYRARYNGAKWILHADADEFIFSGIAGWDSGWEEQNGIPKPVFRDANDWQVPLKERLDNVPEHIPWVGFGSLTVADGEKFCRHPLEWSDLPDMIKNADAYHLEVEAKDPSNHFFWNRMRCTEYGQCIDAPGVRKVAIRPTRVTFPMYLRVHSHECSTHFPWTLSKKEASELPDWIPGDKGVNLHVNVSYVRHLRCMRVRDPPGSWFM